MISTTLPEAIPASELTLDVQASNPLSIVSVSMQEAAEASMQTAVQTLIAHAHSQAIQAARVQDVELLRQCLAEAQTANMLQRANVEQARRVAECLRTCQEQLLAHITQPCFVLDRGGTITHWNPALERWSGVPAAQAEGTPLKEQVDRETCHRLECVRRAALEGSAAGASQGTYGMLSLQGPMSFRPGRLAAQLTLLPLCRIPGTLEAILVLIVPQEESI